MVIERPFVEQTSRRLIRDLYCTASESSVESADGSSAAKKTRGSKHRVGAGSDGERQSVIFVEPVLDGAAPTALGFKRLDDSVRALEKKFQALDEFANNPEMIERVKGSKADPLSDMWHVINVSKRLDASEQGIDKLTTVVQDLIKSDKVEITGGGNLSEELGSVNERIVELESQLAYLSGDVAELKNLGDTEAIGQSPSGTGRHTPSVKQGAASKTTVATAGETEASSVAQNLSATTAPSTSTAPTAPTYERSDKSPDRVNDQPTPNESVVQRKPSSTGKRRSVIGATVRSVREIPLFCSCTNRRMFLCDQEESI